MDAKGLNSITHKELALLSAAQVKIPPTHHRISTRLVVSEKCSYTVRWQKRMKTLNGGEVALTWKTTTIKYKTVAGITVRVI